MLFRSGKPPICVSRYSFGDAELDSTAILVDVVNALDGVVTGTVTEAVDAAGGGAANLAAPDSQGTFLVSLTNVAEAAAYQTTSGTVMGEAYSLASTFTCPYVSDGSASTFEYYFGEMDAVALENTAIVTALNVRLEYASSEWVSEGSRVLPCLQFPGTCQLKVQIMYEST